jgi:hypothetical protein
VIVNAAASFSATIQQQLEMLQSDPSPADLAKKTIDYAESKTAYFKGHTTIFEPDTVSKGHPTFHALQKPMALCCFRLAA